jgi:hypothetical protein
MSCNIDNSVALGVAPMYRLHGIRSFLTDKSPSHVVHDTISPVGETRE